MHAGILLCTMLPSPMRNRPLGHGDFRFGALLPMGRRAFGAENGDDGIEVGHAAEHHEALLDVLAWFDGSTVPVRHLAEDDAAVPFTAMLR